MFLPPSCVFSFKLWQDTQHLHLCGACVADMIDTPAAYTFVPSLWKNRRMRIYLMTASNNNCDWFRIYLNKPHHMRSLLAINSSASNFDVLLTVHLSIFISVINQLDAQNFCFTISFISWLYMFRAHVLIIMRSKLHYTASGIITPIGVK